MSYRQFTIKQAIDNFGLKLIEQGNIFPQERRVSPSPYLEEFIRQNLQLAIALNTEKARSELLICPVLLAVRELQKSQIGLFSGEDFSVEPETGLNGTCNFVLSLSSEQSFIRAPVAVIVEAKKEDLKSGLGQCIATTIAAEKFNQQANNQISTVYGVVTIVTLWRFLKLEGKTVTLDLGEYLLPPIEPILGKLVQMVEGNPNTNHD
ncbi:MAG: hypothetical protein AAGA60_00400 [Cyanobacteria bacterium P01_E01_bin.42]